MFALMDCNNFFVSCERAFNPKLEKKPVVVLSNNDGCVISRSNETKAIGIAMGVPLFKIQETIRRFNVHVLSSNFSLYGDMSNRVMAVLQEFCPELEIYSIDEAFLNLSQYKKYPLIEYAHQMRKKIKQCTGIPTCIGIAPTKTLAKIANTYAKKLNANGVFQLTSRQDIEQTLKQFPVADIWGIGRNLAPKLTALGINNAYDLMKYPPKILRKHFNVTMERMVYELQGISCLPLEEVAPRKNIQSTRSFGKPVVQLVELQEAVSTYTARAFEKLRSQQSFAQAICVYLRTSYYKDKSQYYNDHKTLSFIHATDDTRIGIHYACQIMEELYRPGFQYYKCGVILFDLIPNHIKQKDVMSDIENYSDPKLMQILDTINKKYGKDTLILAAEGIDKKWQMKSATRSPHYTTDWKDILKVA